MQITKGYQVSRKEAVVAIKFSKILDSSRIVQIITKLGKRIQFVRITKHRVISKNLQVTSSIFVVSILKTKSFNALQDTNQSAL